MPRKSTVRLVLEEFTQAELKGIAAFRGLGVGGNKLALVRRIAEDTRRRLDDLVSTQGSGWTRDEWNDFVEERLDGRRRKAWADVRLEIEERFLGGYALVDDLLILICPHCEWHNEITSGWCAACGAALTAQEAPPPPRQSLSDPSGFESLGEDGSSSLARSLPQPSVGQLLADRFRIVRSLGEGGFACAYEIVDTRLADFPALVAKLPSSEEARPSLVHEVRKVAHLSHPNICKYHLVYEDRRFGQFLVMQHGGRSLYAVYRQRGAPLSDAVPIFAQAAEGLDYLHANRVVHGDVSPMNILLDDKGQVRVTDFGIAGDLQTKANIGMQTRVATVRGRNSAFAPPEVYSGRLQRASDQYMLASSFCAVIRGVEPWFNECRHHFQRLSSSQQAALDRALLRDATRRFRSCAEFVNALR